MTVAQLEKRLIDSHGQKDKKVAKFLQDVELSERLNSTRLAQLMTVMPGDESRHALSAVADMAAFLDLPAGEAIADAPLTAQEQESLIARLRRSATEAEVPLPNVNAMRTIDRFVNLKFFESAHTGSTGPIILRTASIPVVTPVPLFVDHTTDLLGYRAGEATIPQPMWHPQPPQTVVTGLEEWSGFRGVLNKVMKDMPEGGVAWRRWEPGPSGKLAVFHFAVNEGDSHLALHTLVKPEFHGYDGHPGFDGEIAVDPASATVYRYVLRAVMEPGQAVDRTDIAVEFAQISFDGASYIVPSRAVAVARAKSLTGIHGSGYASTTNWSTATLDYDMLTWITETNFTGYRVAESTKPAALPDRDAVLALLKASRKAVSVGDLQRMIGELQGRPDRDFARALGDVELSEQLSDGLYEDMRMQMPGKASLTALLAIFDLAAFKPLPRSAQIADPVPDQAAQGRIISSALQYVANFTRRLPDLFATRTVARYEDLYAVRGVNNPMVAAAKPFGAIDQSTGTVKFRDGRELVEPVSKSPFWRAQKGLDTWGTFGPVLQIALRDALSGRIGWSHWEKNPAGALAVFRFTVPRERSEYEVRFCCYLGDDGLPGVYNDTPAYSGEIAVDAATGAVLRIVMKADLKTDTQTEIDKAPKVPLFRADLMVEYAPVLISSRVYIVPVRSLSVMTSWTLGLHGPLKQFNPYADKAAVRKALKLMEHSRVTAINEATFSDYHLFGSEMRIVSDPIEKHN